MEWYIIEFEPFDYPLGKHYLGYHNNNFILVSKSAAKLFSDNTIIYDEDLKAFLKNKNYKLKKPRRIYDVIKYRH